jgi:hypothetical protein
VLTTTRNNGAQNPKGMRARGTLAGIIAVLAVYAGSAAQAVDLPKPQPADWVDPLYTQPYIDIDEWRDVPVRHRYVHGGFKGTDSRFSFYLPPKEQFQGRFFQPISPVSGNENVAQQVNPQINPAITQELSTIGFAAASGGYLVESNLGRKDIYPGPDNTIVGYRAAAAAAKYSKVVAAEMYGKGRIYGYAFGPSGGSLKTISLAESTTGIWDGFIPYVTGSTMSMPSMFTVQLHAARILMNKFPQIVDAIDPGGSGDMYAGLNDEEKAALREVTRMGFPPAEWFSAHRVITQFMGTMAAWVDNVVKWDPTYFEDFWRVPGYLGANPTESLKRARVQHTTRIAKVVMTDEARTMNLQLPMAARATDAAPMPAAIKLEAMPTGDLTGVTIYVKSGAAAGHKMTVPGIVGDLLLVGYGQDEFNGGVTSIKAGDEVLVDNSVQLAVQTYHRHQVPTPDYYVWDQFRGADGKPLYPQQAELAGPKFQMDAAGSIQSGKINGKMIVLESLMDEIAYPWQADWYRSKVKAALGARFDENFRLYFTDNAMHGAPTKAESIRIINYTGVLQQALRDLAAWVEKGTPPPANTAYKVVDGQVKVPESAMDRKGLQPVVTVTANGGARADVSVGTPVSFVAVVETPSNKDKIVAAEWDFEGSGDYPVTAQMADNKSARVTLKTTYSFSKPGTYFPVLRATSQREGAGSSPYARVRNLGRARVVVK